MPRDPDSKTGDASEPDPEPPQRSAQGLHLDISGLEGGWLVEPRVEELVRAAAHAVFSHPELAGDLPAAVCIALAGDSEVQTLNASWRGKDKATNVLSFPAPAGAPREPGSQPFAGDIIIARETVAAEADELGITFAAHLQHLVVHGLLHLLGFDHEEDAEAEAMEALETEILASIGVADPYPATSS